MASSLATTSALTKATTLVNYNGNNYKQSYLSKVSFRLPTKPKLRIFTKGLQPSQSFTIVKAQFNKVVVYGTSNAAVAASTKLDVATTEAKDENSSMESSAILATEESVSDFMNQVSSLVKLVDSRDIVELQLKQHDFEVIIRKKEALPQPPVPAATMRLPPPPVYEPSSPVPPPVPSQASAPAPSPTPSAPIAKSAKSSVPSLKSPMAGTFYRSSAPGEPPFVKVGDKVQKGQVLCIIEAMKLMNEIEADQSGTVVEILMEDGKPVSVDTPLFAIQP